MMQPTPLIVFRRFEQPIHWEGLRTFGAQLGRFRGDGVVAGGAARIRIAPIVTIGRARYRYIAVLIIAVLVVRFLLKPGALRG